MIPKVKALTAHEKRAITASTFHPAGAVLPNKAGNTNPIHRAPALAVPTKRPGNCTKTPKVRACGLTRNQLSFLRRASGCTRPAQIIAWLKVQHKLAIRDIIKPLSIPVPTSL